MTQYFLCLDCSKVSEVNEKPTCCPQCKSTNGHMMTNEEFKTQHAEGVIKTIDPRTGKPMK